METKIYIVIAVFSSIIFLYKLVMLISIGDGADIEMDGDSSGESFELVSLQSIMTFLMSFGWSALAFRSEFELPVRIALPSAVIIAFLFAYLFSLALYKLKKLSSDELSDIIIPVGTVAEVYVSIPVEGNGSGKIKVNYHGQTRYLTAFSDGEALDTSTSVVITKSYPLTVKENN